MERKIGESCVGCINEPVWEKVPYTIYSLDIERKCTNGYEISGYCYHCEDDVAMNSSCNGSCSGFRPKKTDTPDLLP